MEKLFEIIGGAVSPTSFIGGALILLFWLRRQESGIRTEITSSLERLQNERKELEKVNDEQNDKIDTLLKEKRELDQKLHEAEWRAERAENTLEKIIGKGENNG